MHDIEDEVQNDEGHGMVCPKGVSAPNAVMRATKNQSGSMGLSGERMRRYGGRVTVTDWDHRLDIIGHCSRSSGPYIERGPP